MTAASMLRIKRSGRMEGRSSFIAVSSRIEIPRDVSIAESGGGFLVLAVIVVPS